MLFGDRVRYGGVRGEGGGEGVGISAPNMTYNYASTHADTFLCSHLKFINSGAKSGSHYIRLILALN